MKRNRFQKAEEIFRENNGILRTSQAIELGIAPATLYAMRESGSIIQENRGLYRLADQEPPGSPDLVQVALLVPKAVICLISALAFHDLTTQIPHRVWIALPRQIKKPRISYPKLEVIWRSKEAYFAGIEVHELDGVPVRIYSREKTLADCFYYEDRVGKDVMLEAVKEYVRKPNVRVDELMRQARINKVEDRLRPYLEALL